MSEPVTIVLLGEPVAFARTRPNPAGALFTPKKQRNATAVIRLLAQEQMGDRPPIDVPVKLTLCAEMAIPKTWSRKKQLAASSNEIHPGKRPDLSNQIKLLEDAINGIVYRDDCLIVEMHCKKRYSAQPKLIATITPLPQC